MPALQTCPPRQSISDYALGRLSDDESDRLADHLSQCAACFAHLDGLDETSDPLVQGLRGPHRAVAYYDERECELAVERCTQVKLADASPSLPPDLGTLRDYRLIRELGRGGMGTVYEAIHVPLDRRVALKVLPPQRMENYEAVQRFQREMRAIGKLDHPNIVRALDAGNADGKHYLVMEHIDGLDLATVARRVGQLPVADACEIVRQAAAGLQYVHQKGLVHRDVKPSNLMLTHQGQIKILDLGLALLSETLPDTGELTSEGQVMGTLDYMAPEQFGDAHQVDTRADIYSLGATLYRLLTGRAPYADSRYNSPTKKLVAIATKPVEPVSGFRDDVPADVVYVVDRMMAKNPDERYATAEMVVEALAPFTDESHLPELVAEVQSDGSNSTNDNETAPDQLQHSPESVSKAEGSTFNELESALVETRPMSPAPLPSIVEAVPKGIRSANRPWIPGGLIAIAAALVLIAFAATLYYIQTDNGTLVVEVADDRIDVILKEQGLTVYDRDSNRQYTISTAGDRKLPQGEYTLTVADDAGLTVDTKEFTLTRGDRVIVKITRDGKAPERANAFDGDRAAAQWVLANGGKVTIAVEDQEPIEISDSANLPESAFTITYIRMENTTACNDVTVAKLRGLKSLERLDLVNVPVTDVALEHIGHFPSLSKLTFGSTYIRGSGLRHLAQLESLTELWIFDNPIDRKHLPATASFPNLTTLGLKESITGNEDLAQLRLTSKLHYLQLTGTRINGGGVQHLSSLKNLEQLMLHGTEIGDADCEIIINSCPHLRILDVNSTHITEVGYNVLSESLPNCTIRWEPPIVGGQQTAGNDWTSLFDGNTFAGWEGNFEAFRIEDGAIVGGPIIRGTPTYEFLCTLKKYNDFELKVAVKIVGDDNGGVQFRSHRASDDFSSVRGYQADFGRVGGKPVWGNLHDLNRRNINVAEPDAELRESIIKPNDWNALRIRCEGTRIQIWLNGTQTVDYTEVDESTFQPGIIALEFHAGLPSEVWYKDIQIRELQ